MTGDRNGEHSCFATCRLLDRQGEKPAHTIAKGGHGQNAGENTLIVAIHKATAGLVSKSSQDVGIGINVAAHPPKQAKQAMLKTLKFFTSAFGPDAPVSALRRARAALSTLVSGTAPIVTDRVPSGFEG